MTEAPKVILADSGDMDYKQDADDWHLEYGGWEIEKEFDDAVRYILADAP